jgi:hypothetical protein
VEIDTEVFEAITVELADTRQEVRQLQFDRTLIFAEGAAFQAEQANVRRPGTTGRHARPRGHLRLVPGSER